MSLSVHDESEYRTRRQRIDPLLKAAGWKIVEFNPGTPAARYTSHAVTE